MFMFGEREIPDRAKMTWNDAEFTRVFKHGCVC